jgi:hypothetical protein
MNSTPMAKAPTCRGCRKNIADGELRYGNDWHVDCWSHFLINLRHASHTGAITKKALPMPKRGSRRRPSIRAVLVAELERKIGADPGSIKLYGASGWYRRRSADCMPFTGRCIVGGIHHYIESWHTMTECIRKGFTADLRDLRTWEIKPLT